MAVFLPAGSRVALLDKKQEDVHTNPSVLLRMLPLDLYNPSEPVSLCNWEHIFTRALIALQINYEAEVRP